MKVAKRTSNSLLALVGHGPNYVSKDTVVGLAECLQFFPADYKNASETGVEEAEPDDDGEVKTKKKKKKRSKAVKEGGKDENKEDGTGPDDRADNEGGEDELTDGEDDEEGSEYETDDEESDDPDETPPAE